jgi:hypothetical protein
VSLASQNEEAAGEGGLRFLGLLGGPARTGLIKRAILLAKAIEIVCRLVQWLADQVQTSAGRKTPQYLARYVPA